jgi:seryl-tRNA synthetase
VLDCGCGTFGLKGDYLALLLGIDRTLVGWASELGAAPRRYPTLISTETLLRTDYYTSFPSQATFAVRAVPDVHAELKAVVGEARLQGRLDRPTSQLRPALCYHVYEELAGKVVGPELLVFTTGGPCYRHEDEPARLTRQREFTMREIVLVGDPEAIRERRLTLRRRSEALARDLGLEAKAEVATDVFFGTASRGRLLYQRERQLKWELLQPLRQGDPLAIASFNLHEEYFGHAFGIHRDEARSLFVSTGCAAWGLERWVAALVDRHGPEATRWPETARKLVQSGAPLENLG